MKTLKTGIRLCSMVMGIVIIISSGSKAQDDKKKKGKVQETKTYTIEIVAADTVLNGKKWNELSEEEQKKFQDIQKEIRIHHIDIDPSKKGAKAKMQISQKRSPNASGITRQIVIVGDSISKSDINFFGEGDTIIVNGKRIAVPIPPVPPVPPIPGFSPLPFEFDTETNTVIVQPEGDKDKSQVFIYSYINGDKKMSVRIYKLKEDELSKLKPGEKINENKFSDIRIYPNPNDGIFKLSFSLKDEGPVKITVSDLHGKEILSETIAHTNKSKYEHSFNLKDYENGVYFITLTQGENRIVRKIIIGK